MSIRKCLIPCGGRGTRMLDLTGGAPKELIEVAGVPVLLRVLAECAESSVEEVLVVIAPDKSAIVDVVAPVAGKKGMPRRISFATQNVPRGLADAIRMGSGFAEDDAFAVALPDNLFAGAAPGLKQVIETHEATGKNVVAMVEITLAEASRRGPTSVYPGRVSGDEFIIERIPGKAERGTTFDTGGAASALTGVGRYVFTQRVFEEIDAVEETLPAGAELDDVPVMQRLLDLGMLTGRRIQGRFFDVGLVSGYEEAVLDYGGLVGRE